MNIYRMETRNGLGAFCACGPSWRMNEMAERRGLPANFHNEPLFPCNYSENPPLYLPTAGWVCGCQSQELLFEWFPDYTWRELHRYVNGEIGYAEFSVDHPIINVKHGTRQSIFNRDAAIRTKWITLEQLACERNVYV